jgi:hypothetical protein
MLKITNIDKIIGLEYGKYKIHSVKSKIKYKNYV